MINTVTVMVVLGILAALAGTVLAFIFILPEKKRPGLNKFFGFLHDAFNFKFLIIEKILVALYVFATLACVCVGVLMLFGFISYDGYYSSYTRWYGGYGLLLAILGPIALRLVFEVLMMLILLVKNVIQINQKLKNQNEESGENVFAVPSVKEVFTPAHDAEMPQRPAPQAPAFCTKCGSHLNPDSTCPNGCN